MIFAAEKKAARRQERVNMSFLTYPNIFFSSPTYFFSFGSTEFNFASEMTYHSKILPLPRDSNPLHMRRNAIEQQITRKMAILHN